MPKQMTLTSANGMTLYTANKYVNEDIEIVLDAETQKLLKPENIRKGVTILGITGTFDYEFASEEDINNLFIENGEA